MSELSGIKRYVKLKLIVAGLALGRKVIAGNTTSEKGTGPGLLHLHHRVEVLPVHGIRPGRSVSQGRPEIGAQDESPLQNVELGTSTGTCRSGRGAVESGWRSQRE